MVVVDCWPSYGTSVVGLHASYDRNVGAKGDIDSQLNKTVGETEGWVYVALVRVSDNHDFVFPWSVIVQESGGDHRATCNLCIYLVDSFMWNCVVVT
ncbi:hypothetical protein Hanom_Chr14g01271481 [Helianthus anomalus]